MRIFNPSAVAVRVELELRTGSGTHAAGVDLGAGQTVSFDDFVATVYPQLAGDVEGALMITAPSPVTATSRTYNLTANGTYGLYVPARRESQLFAPGETAYLVQLQENTAYRCNFGMTSYAEPVTVSARAFDLEGNTLANKVYSVAAGQSMQIERVFVDMGVALPVDAAGLELTVMEGTVFLFASVNDNRTGDGTLIEATR